MDGVVVVVVGSRIVGFWVSDAYKAARTSKLLRDEKLFSRLMLVLKVWI